MITLIDYGLGNLLSVRHALESLGEEVFICREGTQLGSPQRLILPGVGSFARGMNALKERGFLEPLHQWVVEKRVPILGICLGLQLMAEEGNEGGSHKGLGWLKGTVARLPVSDPSVRVPHVGWEAIQYKEGSPLFKGVPQTADVYFVHSYALIPSSEEIVEAQSKCGSNFLAAARKDNIFGTQFHPEKSQSIGRRILKNFLAWQP